MLIDSTKVMINIASASMTTLRTNLADGQGPSALLKKAEDTTRDMLKIPVTLVPSPDAGGETTPAHTPTSVMDPVRDDLKDH
jgi:hypothetical protein